MSNESSLEILTLEEQAVLKNVRYQSFSERASYPRRAGTSFAPPRIPKPHVCRPYCCLLNFNNIHYDTDTKELHFGRGEVIIVC
jgi:hypothetical protein